MPIELNRRTFLAVLGVATVAASAARRNPRPCPTAPSPSGGICFFGETPAGPADRPRTSAITYLQDS